LNGAFHGAAEGDAPLKLLADRFGDQLSIELRLANFDNVDDHVAVGEFGDRLTQFLDIGALLSNHNAGTCRVNRDAALLVRPLDHDV
jgi:hypothetical protein